MPTATNKLGIDFRGDLEAAINDLPNTLTVGVRRYQVVADDERRAVEVEEPGRFAIYDRSIVAVLSQFPSVPAIQSTVTLDSVQYYIVDGQRFWETDTLRLTLRREDGNV